MGQQRITSVDADFASDYGSIKAEWYADVSSAVGGISSKEMTYSVTIPANTSATLRLPIADGLYVYESGQEAELAEGVTYMGTSDGYAIYEVGSGSYLFSVSSEIPDGLGEVESGKLKVENDAAAYNLAGQQIVNSKSSNGKWLHGIVITGGKKIAVK